MALVFKAKYNAGNSAGEGVCDGDDVVTGERQATPSRRSTVGEPISYADRGPVSAAGKVALGHAFVNGVRDILVAARIMRMPLIIAIIAAAILALPDQIHEVLRSVRTQQ